MFTNLRLWSNKLGLDFMQGGGLSRQKKKIIIKSRARKIKSNKKETTQNKNTMFS